MTAGTGGFTESPGYQFRLNQGLNAVQKSAAARGLLGSGGTMKALNDYAQGQASSEFENYANRLAAMAGIGQTSTNQTGVLGANTANQIGQNQLYSGQAQASSYINGANSANAAISNGVYGLQKYLGSSNASVPGPILSLNPPTYQAAQLSAPSLTPASF